MIVLTPTDIASGEDRGPKDGTFDNFVNPGTPSLVDSGFTEFRLATEFHLGTVAGSILSTVLSFDALSPNTPAVIEIHGYTGDGTVSLADIGFTANLLGSVSGALSTNSLDVTAFVSAGSFAGFSLDEAPRLPPPTPTTNRFNSFQLTLTTADVPGPATLWLTAGGLLAAFARLRRGIRAPRTRNSRLDGLH